MTRSQNGALLLSCAALSSATPCRFIPALSLITLSARASTFGGIVRPISFQIDDELELRRLLHQAIEHLDEMDPARDATRWIDIGD